MYILGCSHHSIDTVVNDEKYIFEAAFHYCSAKLSDYHTDERRKVHECNLFFFGVCTI